MDSIAIACRWREYFKHLSNPVTITLLDTHKVELGEENTITAAEVLPAYLFKY